MKTRQQRTAAVSLTDPPAAPPCCYKRQGGYVYDTLAAHDAGGHLPPFTQLVAVLAGAVALNVSPSAGGPSLLVEVPVGDPVPLPGCPGWSAQCHGTVCRAYPDTSAAWVHLTHDGETFERRPTRDNGPTCPF